MGRVLQVPVGGVRVDKLVPSRSSTLAAKITWSAGGWTMRMAIFGFTSIF